MIELISIITPIALLDSLSLLPVCIIPIIILLTSERPVFYTNIFLLGILIVYIPFGLLLVFGFNLALEAAGQFISNWIKQEPNSADILLQLLIGLALIAWGYQIAKKHTHKLEEQPKIRITARMTFTFSSVLMISGLWGALPYFAAADQILRADLRVMQMLLAILYYNLIFISPLVALFILGIVMGPAAKPVLEKIVMWLLHYGKIIITLALYILGAILIADAIGWFIGMPIIKFNVHG